MKAYIVDYDPNWPALFNEEANRIGAALGKYLVATEHVGSTAVPLLAAKPVIDIQIGVASLKIAGRYCIQPMIDLGYEYVQVYEQAIPERRFFRKNDHRGVRTHNAHMVVVEGKWWKRHLAFRDYLRARSDARRQYEALKRDLAARDYDSINDYADEKTEFIRSIEAIALAEGETETG